MKKKITLFLLASVTLMAACQSNDLSLNGPAKKGKKTSKTLKTRSEEQPGSNYSDVAIYKMNFPQNIFTEYPNLEYDIRSMAFSPDGQHIAFATSDFHNPVRFPMVKFNKFDRTFSKMNEIALKGYDGWLNSVSYSHDGKILAVGNGYNTFGVSLLERNGDTYTELSLPYNGHRSLYCHFSKGGNFLITGGGRDGETTGVNHIIKRTGPTSFTEVTGVDTDTYNAVSDCTISPDEKYFAFFTWNSGILMNKHDKASDTFSRIYLPSNIHAYGTNGCFSPDSRFLAIGDGLGLNILKVENDVFSQVMIDRVPNLPVIKCLFSPNGQFLFALTGDELWIYKRDGDQFNAYNVLNAESSPKFSYAQAMCISPDGTTLLFTFRDSKQPIAAYEVMYYNSVQ